LSARHGDLYAELIEQDTQRGIFCDDHLRVAGNLEVVEPRIVALALSVMAGMTEPLQSQVP
jgi:hypothetical protein